MAMTNKDEAVRAKCQRTTPCHDCPMRRKHAIPSWLGGSTTSEYLDLLHSDSLVHCHTEKGPQSQCAGAAIYRANTHKQVKNPKALVLPANKSVFESPAEFAEYHSKKNLKKWYNKKKKALNLDSKQ